MTAPDFNNLDKNEMMAGVEPLVQDLAKKGTIKEGMTEQEMKDAMFEPMMDYMVEAFEKTVDKADKIEQEVEYTVIEKDGKFLVEKQIEE